MRGAALRQMVIAAAVVAAAGLLAGCTGASPTETSTPTGEKVSADLSKFYDQKLTWSSCEDGMQCTSAIAPLDWTKPTGETIHLALIRHTATSGHSEGTLFTNPGGPGASGYDFLASGVDNVVDKKLSADYDVVGFDPRGVGRSSAVTCSDKALDEFIYGQGSADLDKLTVGSDAWFDASEKYTAAFGADCLKNTGLLLAHVSTVEVAKDLDMLRAAVGAPKLDYLGYSYGTFIGATYAGLFPQNTGRLVLDGAVDPAQSYVEVSVTQSKGFENALRAYLAACVTRSDCPFHGTVDAAIAKISALMDALDASPIRNTDGRKLDSTVMQTAIDLPLYSESDWSYLDKLFTSVFAGKANVAFALADSYYNRDADGTYSSNLISDFLATTCLDYPAMASREQARAEAAKYGPSAGVFGEVAGYASAGCVGWPFSATGTIGPITAAGSAPIIVVGTTNDPATPYSNAVSLAKELQNGHLISYTGQGHTAYNGSSACVDAAVDAYFLDGTVPASDPHC